MIKRVVDVTTPAYISLRRGQLCIESEESGQNSVPVEDLGVLLLSNPRISLTHAVHAACAANNTLIICCDEKFLPAAILLPLAGNALTGKVTRAQVLASAPNKKRLWQEVVKKKIFEQQKTLTAVGADSTVLLHYIEKVKSGDSSNVEAQAARVYWVELFGKGFRRRQDEPGINGLLNYGYAIIRASVARAIVGAGLSPVFGIKHSNQYNHLSLVDDVVEPFRPWVDAKVQSLVKDLGAEEVPTVGKIEKASLLEILSSPCSFDGKTFPLMVALHSFAADVREVLCGEKKSVSFVERY